MDIYSYMNSHKIMNISYQNCTKCINQRNSHKSSNQNYMNHTNQYPYLIQCPMGTSLNRNIHINKGINYQYYTMYIYQKNLHIFGIQNHSFGMYYQYLILNMYQVDILHYMYYYVIYTTYYLSSLNKKLNSGMFYKDTSNLYMQNSIKMY